MASGEDLSIYTPPAWVYVGYLTAIGGAGLFMWAGAESQWAMCGAGVGVLAVGTVIIYLQKMHRKAWARKNNLPEE